MDKTRVDYKKTNENGKTKASKKEIDEVIEFNKRLGERYKQKQQQKKD